MPRDKVNALILTLVAVGSVLAAALVLLIQHP